MKAGLLMAWAILSAGLTGCNSETEENMTEAPSFEPVVSLPSPVVAEERTQVSLATDIRVDESYTLSFTNPQAFNFSAAVSNDGKNVTLKTPSVSSDTRVKLTLTANNGHRTAADTTTINILDSLPDAQETYITETAGGKELQNLIDRFLSRVTSSEYYLDGLIVSNATVAPHSKTINMSDYADSHLYVENLPPDRKWRIGRSKIYDMTVIQDESGRVWLLEDGQFLEGNNISYRATNKILPSVVLWGSSDNQLRFQYVYLHNNTNFINALNLAYMATSDEKYMTIAQQAGHQLTKLLENGLYKRQFLNEENPVYTGMNQGIILESIFDLARLAQSKELYAESKKIAGQYTHTTEGVWNHYTNSAIGGLIAEKLGVENDIDISSDIDNKIPYLINEIERLDGKIPYIMDKQDDRYLNMSPTYHTYDFMLQTKLSLYINDRLNLHSVLDEIVDEIEVNYSSFYANNTEALLYAYQSSRYINMDFARNQKSMINATTSDLVGHISYLRAAAALLMLHEHTDYPSLD